MTPHESWAGGIIAAGFGRRLRRDDGQKSKAMACVANVPLIDRALEQFLSANVDQVTVLINEDSSDCHRHLQCRVGLPHIDLVVRSTPSSFASFLLVVDRLLGEKSVITTVDSVMPPGTLLNFLNEAARLSQVGLFLAVTSHVDDEAPLWVDVDQTGQVIALGKAAGTLVTAGLYAWSGSLPHPDGIEFGRLREYLSWIVDSGYPVFAIEVPQVLDVDRPQDVIDAERAIGSWAAEALEYKA